MTDARAACAIIVNWNKPTETAACVKSLQASTMELDILIVDNGSTRVNLEALELSLSSDVRILRMPNNLGFAGACNFGAHQAVARGSRHLIFMNNDVEVEPDAIGRMVECASSQDAVAAVGPAVFTGSRQDPALWSIGGFVVPALGAVGNRVVNPASLPRLGILEVDYVPGCVMLISAETFLGIGDFSEEYFLYFEDVDWCLRARSAGLRCLIQTGAVVWHLGGASMINDISYYFYWRSKRRFLENWTTGLPTFVGSSVWLGECLIIACYNLARGRQRRSTLILRAVSDAFHHRTEMPHPDSGLA